MGLFQRSERALKPLPLLNCLFCDILKRPVGQRRGKRQL